MHLTGIIRKRASRTGCAALLLAAAACTPMDRPRSGGTEIAFSASYQLMRNDTNTKAGTLKDGFVTGDSFMVFGRRDTEHTSHQYLFNSGNGSVVTLQGNGAWNYSPKEEWDWTGTESDHYEFVGIYPIVNPTDRTSLDSQILRDYPGNIAVGTTYNVGAGDNYDLMAAAFYRDGSEINERTNIVPMSFYHMTSAVDVEIINNSNTKIVRIESIGFKYITSAGQAFITLDDANLPERTWKNTERSMSAQGVAVSYPDMTLSKRLSMRKGIDLMIPQRLDQEPVLDDYNLNPADFLPRLCITYTPYEIEEHPNDLTPVTSEIVLKDVPRANGGDPITSWEMGYKYTYYVSMRLDGGLLVELITTKWDVVEAHTWGLLI